MSIFRIYQRYLELNLRDEIKKNGEKNQNFLSVFYGLLDITKQDINSPKFNRLCKDILEMNVTIAYEMFKSDKLYI